MADTIKISVVTPCFNSEKTLRETIESVRGQDYQHWEHIVIDGGSNDGTIPMLKEYPHLQWISEPDQGHYHAMNKGIARATGEVINILNADDCFTPGALGRVAAAFAAQPSWDGLFGDVIFVDDQGTELYRRQEAQFDYDVLRYAFDYIWHQSLFVKKAVHERLGDYQYQRFKNACDYEFLLRMAKAGCRIGQLPEYVLKYRFHEFGQSVDKRIQLNTLRESDIVKGEHGCPSGWLGRGYFFYGHARRQWQKLWRRGKMDIIPAKWILRRHMRSRATFSSNCGLDRLPVEPK